LKEVFAEAKGSGFDVKIMRRIIADRQCPICQTIRPREGEEETTGPVPARPRDAAADSRPRAFAAAHNWQRPREIAARRSHRLAAPDRARADVGDRVRE
jgi:hypothetical protein